jgi:hypothetical protein
LHPAAFNLTVEAAGHVTHADGATEQVTLTDTVAFGLDFHADGEVTHANPELWQNNQLKEQ